MECLLRLLRSSAQLHFVGYPTCIIVAVTLLSHNFDIIIYLLYVVAHQLLNPFFEEGRPALRLKLSHGCLSLIRATEHHDIVTHLHWKSKGTFGATENYIFLCRSLRALRKITRITIFIIDKHPIALTFLPLKLWSKSALIKVGSIMYNINIFVG